MKYIVTIILVLVTTFFAAAQTTQSGYVKTKGRMDSKGQLVPGTRLSGAAITLAGGHSTVSGTDGSFTLTIPDKKFFLKNVQKQGYSLTDPDILSKQYVYSSNPLVITMESPEKLLEDQLAKERKLRRELQKRLQQKEDEIDELNISVEEKNRMLMQVNQERDENEKIIREMAKYYATLDYDLLDEFQRQVNAFLENGEMKKADSMLRSRGGMGERILQLRSIQEAEAKETEELERQMQNLKQSKAGTRHRMETIAADCYSYYQLYLQSHRNDSAAYYLELRASLDTENVQWQEDAGNCLIEYTAEYAKAIGYFQRSLQQLTASGGTNSGQLVSVQSGLALAYTRLGNYANATSCLQQAFLVAEDVYGKSHPKMAILYNDYGSVLFEQNKYAEALGYYRNALEIQHAAADDDGNVELANTQNNIGTVCYYMLDYDMAITYYQQALKTYKNVYGEENQYVATVFSNLGSLYRMQGDHLLAMECSQKALAIRKKLFGENHPAVANSYNNVAMEYSAQGDNFKALEYFQRALEIDSKFFGENHNNILSLKSSIRFVIASDSVMMKDYVYTATVAGKETPAAAQGMWGEYVVLEFADWNIDNNVSLFHKNVELQGAPKTILVLQDGSLSTHHFENSIGVRLDLKQVGEQEKNRIRQLYHQWKMRK